MYRSKLGISFLLLKEKIQKSAPCSTRHINKSQHKMSTHFKFEKKISSLNDFIRNANFNFNFDISYISTSEIFTIFLRNLPFFSASKLRSRWKHFRHWKWLIIANKKKIANYLFSFFFTFTEIFVSLLNSTTTKEFEIEKKNYQLTCQKLLKISCRCYRPK